MAEQTVTRQQLHRHLLHLAAGPGGVVVIEAPDGMGKSTLVRGWLDQLAAAGQGALTGRGQLINRPSPFRAWEPIIRHLTAGVHPPIAQAAGSDWANLAPLLGPVLGESWPETPATARLTGAERMAQTSRLLMQLLGLAAAEAAGRLQPLILVMEDADQCDSASWGLLEQVAARLSPLLLVITTQPMAGKGPGEFRRIVTLPRAERLGLSPLTGTEIEALIGDTLQVTTLPEPLVTLVKEQAGGNPGCTVELCRSLLQAGLLQRRAGVCQVVEGVDLAEVPPPPATLRRRGQRLSSTPEQQLSRVIGRAIALGTLAREAGSPDERLGAAESDRVALAYLVTMEAAYNLLLLAPQSVVRDRRGNLITRAVDWFELAGEQALAQGAYREAAICFGEALAHGGESAPVAVRARWEKRRGDALYGLGRVSESIGHYEQAATLAGHPVPRERTGLTRRILAEMGRQALLQIGLPKAERGQVANANTLMAAQVHGMLSVVYSGEQRAHERGLYAALRYLALAQASGDQAELARAYAWSSVAACYMALPGLARHYLHQGRALAQAGTDSTTRGIVAELGGVTLFIQGDLNQAAALAREGLLWFTGVGARRNMLECWGLLAILAYLQGRLAEGLTFNEEVAAVAREFGDTQMEIYLLGLQALTLVAMDRFTEVFQLHARVEELVEQQSAVYQVGFAQFALAHLHRSNRARALAAAEQATGHVLRMQQDHLFLFALDSLAEVYLTLLEQQEELTEAQLHHVMAMADQICARLRQFARTFVIGGPSRYLHTGTEHWLNGRRRAAMRDWHRSLAEAERMGMAIFAGRAHYEIGRHLPPGDQRRFAHLEQAVGILARSGASYYLQRAEAALAEAIAAEPCPT